jgi:hypothetical protein
MTPTDLTTLSVRSTPDLLAAVPYLLGFHPADSAVVVALRGPRIVFVARGDLPDPVPPDPDPAAPGPARAGIGEPGGGPDGPGGLAARLTAVVARQDVDATIVVGYGTPDRADPMLGALYVALDEVGLPVLDVLRVTGNRYWSYACADPGCCPPEGTPFDTSTSQLAAAATFAGQVALPDRDTLVRQLDPVDGPARYAMREATRRARNRLQRLLDRASAADPRGRRRVDPRHRRKDGPRGRQGVVRRAGRSAVSLAMRRYRAGGRLTDDEVAWLSLLLLHQPTRDDAWRRTDGEDWQLALWTDVLRRAEPELVAAPASLLAFAAWCAGQGALANVAVERALDARPDYPMALLLSRALRAGMPPYALDDRPLPWSDGDGPAA